jgi:hypothetical protein
METPFTPTPQDVERYRKLRALTADLNEQIMKAIPRRALDEVGEALGMRRDGILVFDSMDMMSVLVDCCLYDWFQNGKNVVQRYAEAHPPKPGTDEGYLLQACLQAKYRMLVVQSAVAGAGLYCQDVLNNEGLFLMDVALSQSAESGKAALATRTLPLGEYWMTSGAGLPINSKKTALDALAQIAGGKPQLLKGPGSVALLIVRTCLAAGAADHMSYANLAAKPEKSHRRPRS